MYVRELGFASQGRKIKSDEVKCAFYEYVRSPMYICRCVGLLPVDGLGQRSGKETRHSWKLLYTLSCFFLVTLITLRTIIQFCENFLFGTINIIGFYSFAFSFVNLISTLVLLKFSKYWNEMLEQVEAVENTLPILRNAVILTRNNNRLVKICFFIAAMDTILYKANTIDFTIKCLLLEDDSGLYFRSYSLGMYDWYFKYVPYNAFTSITLQISTLLISFIWNFTDIFVVVVSKYLVCRFQDFNHIIIQSEKEVAENGTSRLPWAELKNHYTNLMRLVIIINKNINPIVFMSFTNIMFFGQQIYFIWNREVRNGILKFHDCYLDANENYLMLTYLCTSVTLLLVRTLIISTTAAAIHELSRRPLLLLYTVPSEAYDFEMQRLMDQVYNSKVSLTGLELFYVTRETMLSVMATLLTYEIVMMQI